MSIESSRADQGLIHYETMANRDNWQGDDRDGYLVRTLLHALTCAVLAVACEIRDLREAQE